MNSEVRKKILLSYCPYPGSVAWHIEQALRKRYDVRTWGPPADDAILELQGLASLRGQIIRPDIPYDSTDPADALACHAPGWKPDAFLWIESGVQFGIDLSRLQCPKACYLINTHISQPDLRVSSHLHWGRNFDVAFLAQRQFVQRFQRSGINAHWLPVACDPQMYRDRNTRRIHSLALVGRVCPPHRQSLLEKLFSRYQLCFEWHILEDAAAFYSESRIVWNDTRDKLSRRIFEAMACGTPVLADPANGSGLEELFSDGQHLFFYRSEEELFAKAEALLANDRICEEIAQAGHRKVLELHTYENRVLSMAGVLFPSLP